MKRSGSTSAKSKLSDQVIKNLKHSYLAQIKGIAEIQKVPTDLIINWYQTGTSWLQLRTGQWKNVGQRGSRLLLLVTRGRSLLLWLVSSQEIFYPSRSFTQGRLKGVTPPHLKPIEKLVGNKNKNTKGVA